MVIGELELQRCIAIRRRNSEFAVILKGIDKSLTMNSCFWSREEGLNLMDFSDLGELDDMACELDDRSLENRDV